MYPSHLPTIAPTPEPTPEPTSRPTYLPTAEPTHIPSSVPTHIPTPDCQGNAAALYYLTLFDSGGDGWGGVTFKIENYTSSVLVYSATLSSGYSSTQWVCLTTGCYNAVVDSSDSEISWSLEDPNGVLAEDTAPSLLQICTDNSTFNNFPTFQPTITQVPSLKPSPYPTMVPFPSPTRIPTPSPTRAPILPPTPKPSLTPTSAPTENCVDGQYFAGPSCNDCEAGRYSVIADATDRYPTACTVCDIGCYSNTGASSCIACPEGKFSNHDRSDCAQCYSGQYVNTTSQGCFNCTAGKYSPVALDDLCLECGAGYATGVDETASGCDSCSPGTYSVGDGVVNTCQECAVGFYSECIGCGNGTYAASAGSSSCLNCDPGTSASNRNSFECADCDAGYYSNTRAASCVVCPIGHYADSPGTSACIECAAGSYMNHTAAVACTYCTNGTYQESSTQTSCVNCEIGKYAPALNTKVCIVCDEGDTSVEGAAQCERCDPGYYWAYSKSKNRWSCAVCPDGATCSGGVYQPVAQAGFWIDRTAAAVDASLVGNVYKCARDTCLKLNYKNDTTTTQRRRRLESIDCLLLSNFSSTACNDDLICREGSSGPLCGSCNDGWSYNAQKRICKRCQLSIDWVQMSLSIAFCCVVLAVLWSMRKGFMFIPRPLRFLTNGKSKIRIPFLGIILNINKPALKIMVSTYQIVSSVSWTLTVIFPAI